MSNPERQSQREKVNLADGERMAALGLVATSIFWAVMTAVDAYKKKSLDPMFFQNGFISVGLLLGAGFLINDKNRQEDGRPPLLEKYIS